MDGWRGKIAFHTVLTTLIDAALNGSDLRVRAAAIEIQLAAANVAKTADQVESLFRLLESQPDPRMAGSPPYLGNANAT